MKYLKLFEERNLSPNMIEHDEDYKNGDYTQAIMNYAYSKWNDDKHKGGIDEYMEKNFHPHFALIIMLGKYNYQVENGGHSQYFYNGYASYGSSGIMYDHKDIERHLKMMELLKETPLIEKEIGKKVYNIMKKFASIMENPGENCYGCDGDGTIEDTCDNCHGTGDSLHCCEDCDCEGTIDGEDCLNCNGDGEIEVTCEECGGSGKIDIDCEDCEGTGKENKTHELEQIDEPYYEINNEWLEHLNEYSKVLIDNHTKVIKGTQNINKDLD